jgi:hypothetical protein
VPRIGRARSLLLPQGERQRAAARGGTLAVSMERRARGSLGVIPAEAPAGARAGPSVLRGRRLVYPGSALRAVRDTPEDLAARTALPARMEDRPHLGPGGF